jgi:hypothetical protein
MPSLTMLEETRAANGPRVDRPDGRSRNGSDGHASPMSPSMVTAPAEAGLKRG